MFALRVLKVWRRRTGYEGVYLFPAAQGKRQTAGKPWTYQALIYQLHEACRRAGVPHILYRGMHSLRRMAAKNALALTGDLKQAGEWIGDTDLRTLTKSYLKSRPEEMRALANKMGAKA